MARKAKSSQDALYVVESCNGDFFHPGWHPLERIRPSIEGEKIEKRLVAVAKKHPRGSYRIRVYLPAKGRS